ncbi:MAG: hypothetical protein ABIH86_00960 [Planctomycetota bacterium]
MVKSIALKTVLDRLDAALGDCRPPEPKGIIDAILLSILAEEGGFKAAADKLAALNAQFVDSNDIRVSAIGDIVRALGGDPLDAAMRRIPLRIQQAMRNVFKFKSDMNVDDLMAENRATDVKKFFGCLTSLSREEVALLKMYKFSEERYMVADNASYGVGKALNLAPKGKTRYEFVNMAIEELKQTDSYKLYCIFREIWNECRGPNGEADAERIEKYYRIVYPDEKPGPDSRSKKKKASESAATPKKEKPAAKTTKKDAGSSKRSAPVKPSSVKKPAVVSKPPVAKKSKSKPSASGSGHAKKPASSNKKKPSVRSRPVKKK